MQRHILANTSAIAAAGSQLALALEPCTTIVVPDVAPARSDIVTAAAGFFFSEWEHILTAMMTDGAKLTRGLADAASDFSQIERDSVAHVVDLIGDLDH